MWIVMFGDPTGGFEFVGPFDSEEKAYDYGGLSNTSYKYCHAAAWFVTEVVKPEEV